MLLALLQAGMHWLTPDPGLVLQKRVCGWVAQAELAACLRLDGRDSSSGQITVSAVFLQTALT